MKCEQTITMLGLQNQTLEGKRTGFFPILNIHVINMQLYRPELAIKITQVAREIMKDKIKYVDTEGCYE